MGNFGQFDIAPPAYGQNVGEEEEEQEEKVENDTYKQSRDQNYALKKRHQC